MNYYWVMQGKTFAEEYHLKIVWAPRSRFDHHKIVSQLKKEDKIISYYNKQIVAISEVIENAEYMEAPTRKHLRIWGKEGWGAKINYKILTPPINLREEEKTKVRNLGGPLKDNGYGEEIYMAKISSQIYELIKSKIKNH